eukprot:COSAG03_NODE_23054_length_283_cov_6.032609_1_plen_36_part_01
MSADVTYVLYGAGTGGMWSKSAGAKLPSTTTVSVPA